MAATAHGTDSALRDLLQSRTRDDVSAFGSHWHYHWLSTVWFGAAVAVAPIGLRLITGASMLRIHRLWTGIAWGYFLLLTLIFGMSAEIFVDVRYAGHQAREILTHGLVTLPLGLAILLAWERTRGGEAPIQKRAAFRWLALAGAVLIPLYLVIISLSGDVMAEGQAEMGLSGMVAAHFFEHTLDYLFVVSLVLGAVLLRRAHRSRNGSLDDSHFT